MTTEQHDPTLVPLADEYLDAARTLRVNAVKRARLDDEDAAAKEILAKLLTDGDTGVDETGQPLVRMRPGAHVWSETQARDVLPTDTIERLTVTRTETVLDKGLAKDTLAPAIYAACCKRNKSTVVPA